MKKTILGHPMTPISEKSGGLLYYKYKDGREIEVKITPEWLCPFLPSAAQSVREIDTKNIPYIQLVDQIVFKIDSCGLRNSVSSKHREALDAAVLLEEASEHFPLKLEEEKLAIVEPGLADVVKYCAVPDKHRDWWCSRLGMTDYNRRKSIHDILGDLSLETTVKPSSKTPSPTGSIKLKDQTWWKEGLGSTNGVPISPPATSPGSPTFKAEETKPKHFTHKREKSIKKSDRPISYPGPKPTRPRRHTQTAPGPLEPLSDGHVSLNGVPVVAHDAWYYEQKDCGHLYSPGVTLTNRFESTPCDENSSSGYFDGA